MGPRNHCTRLEEIRGKLLACRSALRTDRTRVAARQEEERRLMAEFQEERDALLAAVDQIAEVGLGDEPQLEPSVFGEPAPETLAAE